MPIDESRIIRELKQCEAKGFIAFAASCCNRVLPSYKVFHREVGWGDFETLTSAVDYIWEKLEEGASFSAEKIDLLIDKCEEATPDLDEVNSELATWGHDAAMVVLCALQCIRDGSADHAAEAASWSLTTVDTFVQVLEDLDPSDRDLEQRIEAHPLMQREWGCVKSDLEIVKSRKHLDTATILKLRHAWSNEGKSNVNLG